MKRCLLFVVPLILIAMATEAQTTVKVAQGEGTEKYRPLIAAVYQQIGLIPEFVSVPIVRALAGVENGTYGADGGRALEAAAGLKNVVFTKVSLFELRLLAVYKVGFGDIPVTAADLSRYRLVKVRGAKLAEEYVSRASLNCETVNDTRSLALFVKVGRADVGLVVSVSPLSLAGLDAQGLIQQEEPILTSKIYHVFHKSLAQYAPLWDAAVTEMQKDGRWAALLASVVEETP